MAIVIDDIPQWQVLDIAAGMPSYLSMFVSGLDEVHLDQVTASLGGLKQFSFVDPPFVSIQPSNSGGPDTVILTLTGTGMAAGLHGAGSIILGHRRPIDPDLTVTITQAPQSAGPDEVLAIYFNSAITVDGPDTDPA